MEIKPEHLNQVLEQIKAQGINANYLDVNGVLGYEAGVSNAQKQSAQAIVDGYNWQTQDAVMNSAKSKRSTELSQFVDPALAAMIAVIEDDITKLNNVLGNVLAPVVVRMLQRQLLIVKVLGQVSRQLK